MSSVSKRIAIVDDSRTILTGLRIALKGLQESGECNFEFFNDPVDFYGALESDEAGPFDLFFLDINMPGMSGIELARKIRALQSCIGIPIYALTTENTQEVQQQGKEAGMNGWIIKQTTPAVVKERIEQVIRGMK